MNHLNHRTGGRLASRHFHAMVLFLVSLLIAPTQQAQVTTATLTGIVRDPSGAVMVGVKVKVTNVQTNISREVLTNDTGTYRVPALNPGDYKIEVELAGFKKTVIPGVILQVNQQGRVDVTMEVGEVSETLTVEGASPIIDTESPMIGGLIDEMSVIGLPLNGRNFMELTTLTAGINEGGGSTAKGGILNRGFAPSAAGMPATENNYQLDGADNKEGFFNTFNVAPSVDAVREFRIQIGQYSAEFGAGGGAVINVVTKSGTNEFHGTGWEFIRNDVLDARNFFLPPTAEKAPLKRNQFGVAAGGPIVKNRTFIFGNYDGTRIRRGLFRSARVPTPTEISGNLSGLGKTIIDPVTKLPFPGNIIPADRIDPISKGLAAYYPAPNASNPSQNYVVSPSSKDDLDSYLVRLDHRISSKHDFMSRYGIQDVDRVTPGTFPQVGGQLQPQRFQNLVLGLTSTLTPSFLNEFRTNYGRTVNRTKGQNTGTPIAADLGIPFALRDSFNAGFTEGVGFGSTIISGIGEGQPWYLTVNNFQWYDGITWTHGSHTLKAGADIKRVRADAALGTHANNSYTFSGQFTGEGFADFLLGIPSSELLVYVPNEPGRFRRTEMAYYVLDDWKVNPKLTLNVGMRYEYGAVPRELGGLTPSFDPTLGNGVGGLLFPSQNKTAVPFYQNNRPDLPVGLLDRETLFKNDKNNFAPRFGFAFRPFDTSKLVIRGGYGIYFSSAQLVNLVQNTVTGPPAQQWPTFVSDRNTPTLNYGGQIGTDPAEAFKSATFGVLTGPENQWLDGYTQQWSLSISQELRPNLVFETQYLGSKSTHLENLVDYNATPPTTQSLATAVPFPKWGRVAGFSNGAAANYNALMLSLEKRYAEGLTFKGAYTFGKSLTKNGGRVASGNITLIQNPFNLSEENGHAADDISHRFTLNYMYELPFGAGKRFGSGWSGALNKVLGGWSVAGITTARSGLYLRPSVGGGNCNAGFFVFCRPDLVGDPFIGGSGVDSPRFNRSAFDWALNTAQHPRQDPRFGTAGFNILKGNGINNWDVSVVKNTMVGERYRIEFRFESFNAWNHPSFSDPNAGPESGNFGRVFSTQTDPRDIQFGLKFYW